MISWKRRADNVGRAALPRWFIWTVVAVCVLPFLLHLLGIDFATSAPGPPPPWEPGPLVDAMHRALAGSFTHALLEWSAFCAALVTAVLAYIHFRITGAVTTPLIGMTLLCAGCVDVFHALAAVRLLEGSAPLDTLIPLTWAISRMFAAVILVSGVALLLRRRDESMQGHWFAAASCVILGIVACVAIQVCASSTRLPRAMFPDSFVTRPYDTVPLLLFVAGVPLFVLFHRRQGSFFSHALLISLIPQIATGAYMAFGSTALFDGPFNIAHGIKIVAYAVPLAGLILDCERSFDERKKATDQLESLSRNLAQLNTEIAVDARIDPLTQVLNRRAWEEAVEIEDERSRRHDHRYSVVMIDVDHFKKFNDAAGHLAGDECLRALGHCLRKSCRMIDVVGRYGGEEFVVLLPETALENAERAAARMLDAIRGRRIAHEGLAPGTWVTASLGIAEGPTAKGWKIVLDRADKALYVAKSQGRNQVVSDLGQAA